MWIHDSIIEPICQPPRSMQGQLEYIERKYLNYFLVYGFIFIVYPTLLISFFFGSLPIERALLHFSVSIPIISTIALKAYRAFSVLVLLVTYSMVYIYWYSPDYFGPYFMPWAGLIFMFTFLQTKRMIAIYSVLVILGTIYIIRERVLTFVETAPREDILIAVNRAFVTMLRYFFIQCLFILFKVYTREKIHSEWNALQKTIAEQNEALKKSNNDLRQALDDRETFILSFSHETRNPLNGLLGNLHILSEMKVSPEVGQILKKSLVCAKILKNILITILDSKKTGESTTSTELTAVQTQMPLFIQEIWTICKDLIHGKGLAPILDVSNSFPTSLEFDTERMTQVILNLVSNSLKFTQKGFIKLSFSWRPEVNKTTANTKFYTASNIALSQWLKGGDEAFYPSWFKSFKKREKGYFIIEVKDSGCGISDENQKVIFDKFAQVGSNSSAKKLGLGLGLWISKSIVNLHKGQILVESQENIGSCFRVVIPTTTTSSDPKESTEIESLSKTTLNNERHSLRALVVDDCSINQEINMKMLEKYGFKEVILASDGAEAVKLVKSYGANHFSLITMDLEMRSMKGKEAIRQIRQWEKANNFQASKIVIISGNVVEKEIEECTNPKGEIAADFFLAKPCTYRKLAQTLDSIELEAPTSLKRMSGGFDKKVLFADDDFFNLDILANYSRQLKVGHLIAKNGKEAVELFEGNSKDIGVVFLDYEMPFMNGIQAAKTIREQIEKQCLDCEVYLLSGIELKSNSQERQYFDGVVQKPFSFQKFEEIIKSTKK